MNYSDLKVVVNEAWNSFYKVLQSNGVDVVSLDNMLDSKDVFNDVMDCVIYNAKLEIEE